MTTIRELTDTWAGITWKMQLSTISAESKIIEKLTDVLEKFGLLEKYVTGQSVTKLEKTQEEQFLKGLNISYTKAFALAFSEDPQKLPILFLRNLALNFDFEKATPERFKGLVARGLRTFPSLMRDRDFGENLRRLLETEGFSETEFSVAVDPEEDIPHHTDVLFHFREKVYRIWLYQLTSRGIPHDVERVLGKRGELPEGIHVLCPLKTDLAAEKEKLEKRLLRLKSRLTNTEERYRAFKKKGCKGALNCQQSMGQIIKDIEKTGSLLNEKSTQANAEVHTSNGWYFYSEDKIKTLIKQTIDVSSSRITPDPYSEVYSIFSAPEKYLSEVRFFSKSS